MSATPRRRCPVCYRQIKPTSHGVIYGHWDSIGRDRCPASWEPYDITIGGRRSLRGDSDFFPVHVYQEVPA